MYPHTKQLILKKMEEGFYPGVAVAFIKENQVETFTAGFAQVVPEKQLMTEDLLFDAASLTKVVATTSLVLRLLEDGKIELDQPLHKYLPEFENQTITLRHLLTHTSDIKTWIPNRDELSQEELIAAYLKLEPGEQLGKEVKYTDAGTILLGLMLEKNLPRNCSGSLSRTSIGTIRNDEQLISSFSFQKNRSHRTTAFG